MMIPKRGKNVGYEGEVCMYVGKGSEGLDEFF